MSRRVPPTLRPRHLEFQYFARHLQYLQQNSVSDHLMSEEAEAAQAEAQAAQVELEYRREEKRENKAMDSKLVAPKFNPHRQGVWRQPL